jgi:tetratricopeptide (TPR) repeat protein
MQMNRTFKRLFSYLVFKAQAVVLLALGRRAGALSRFDRMLRLFPLDRYALASRSHVLFQLDRVDESIASLQQLTCLAGSPMQCAAAWFNLGYELQHVGRHEDARIAFEKATEHDSHMDKAWYGLALVLIHQQQFLKARQALNKNTALQPLSPYGWYRLAEVYLALDAPEKARKVIEHLRQFEPKVAAQLEREAGLVDAVQFQSARCHGPARPTHACKVGDVH